MPFKIFVLAAGVARVPPLEFLVAVAIGRGVRYFGEGLLALWYGERALAFMQENARTVGLVARRCRARRRASPGSGGRTAAAQATR